jgi:hypothetical protein
MSHDTDERLDGLDDALRERLNRLGRSATAGSVPWPGVDRAIRRRRRTSALRTGAAALAVAAVAGAAVVAVPRLLSEPPTPADATVERSHVPPPPWKVPTAGFVPLYENVRVRLATSACGELASINFRDPAKVGKSTVGPADAMVAGDLSVGRPCVQPELTTYVFGVPVLITFPDRPGLPTAQECVSDLTSQSSVHGPEVGYGFSPNGVAPRGASVECAVLPADPKTGEPAAVVGLALTWVRDGVVDVTLSAWTGDDAVEVGTEKPATPPKLPKVGPPFREKYSDVTLRLPGKPEACAAGKETYLELHVPKVSPDLAPSDAALSGTCSDPSAAELQLGGARGVVLTKADVSAAECAAALESGTKVDTFKPAKGTTLCIVSPADGEQNVPAVLVALTVTKVNATSGAFDLSATGWTGTPG